MIHGIACYRKVALDKRGRNREALTGRDADDLVLPFDGCEKRSTQRLIKTGTARYGRHKVVTEREHSSGFLWDSFGA